MDKRQITLPKKHKKDILSLCKEFESLACPRKIRVTVPSIQKIIKVCWQSDFTISIINENEIYSDPYKAKEILKINKKIKSFCEKTERWGSRHFKDKEWLWSNILWNYSSAHGETVNCLKIKWE